MTYAKARSMGRRMPSDWLRRNQVDEKISDRNLARKNMDPKAVGHFGADLAGYLKQTCELDSWMHNIYGFTDKSHDFRRIVYNLCYECLKDIYVVDMIVADLVPRVDNSDILTKFIKTVEVEDDDFGIVRMLKVRSSRDVALATTDETRAVL